MFCFINCHFPIRTYFSFTKLLILNLNFSCVEHSLPSTQFHSWRMVGDRGTDSLMELVLLSRLQRTQKQFTKEGPTPAPITTHKSSTAGVLWIISRQQKSLFFSVAITAYVNWEELVVTCTFQELPEICELSILSFVSFAYLLSLKEIFPPGWNVLINRKWLYNISVVRFIPRYFIR